jgi:hypothetical protein
LFDTTEHATWKLGSSQQSPPFPTSELTLSYSRLELNYIRHPMDVTDKMHKLKENNGELPAI